MKLRNIGFLKSCERLTKEEVCKLLDIKEPTYWKIKSGEINLKLEYAAKLHDVARVAWKYFREWE